MIICHCNQLTSDDLNEAIDQLLAFEPGKRPKPSAVHTQAGCQSKCCGCYPELKRMIGQRMKRVETQSPALV